MVRLVFVLGYYLLNVIRISSTITITLIITIKKGLKKALFVYSILTTSATIVMKGGFTNKNIVST